MLLDSSNWPHTIDAWHHINTNDAYGGNTLTDGPLYATGVAAWVQPASDRMIMEFKSRGQDVEQEVFLLTNPGVHLGDHLEVHGGYLDSQQLKVISYDECTVGFNLLFRVMTKVFRQAPPTATT